MQWFYADVAVALVVSAPLSMIVSRLVQRKQSPVAFKLSLVQMLLSVPLAAALIYLNVIQIGGFDGKYAVHGFPLPMCFRASNGAEIMWSCTGIILNTCISVWILILFKKLTDSFLNRPPLTPP